MSTLQSDPLLALIILCLMLLLKLAISISDELNLKRRIAERAEHKRKVAEMAHRCIEKESISEIKRRQQEAYYKRLQDEDRVPAEVDKSDKFETPKGIRVTWR